LRWMTVLLGIWEKIRAYCISHWNNLCAHYWSVKEKGEDNDEGKEKEDLRQFIYMSTLERFHAIIKIEIQYRILLN
jgi:hypothetical protein